MKKKKYVLTQPKIGEDGKNATQKLWILPKDLPMKKEKIKEKPKWKWIKIPIYKSTNKEIKIICLATQKFNKEEEKYHAEVKGNSIIIDNLCQRRKRK